MTWLPIGDSRVVSPEAPTVNNAIGLGEMDVAEDGNVYLMRRLSPAILYAISPTGDVIRRFTVDPGEPNYMPGSLHVSGKEIAIQFYRPQGSDQLIKVVDLTGQELKSIHIDKSDSMGFGFACYSEHPRTFTYLGEGKSEELELKSAALY